MTLNYENLYAILKVSFWFLLNDAFQTLDYFCHTNHIFLDEAYDLKQLLLYNVFVDIQTMVFLFDHYYLIHVN